jgi:cyclopropane fatty-acyl-phospholipid synthase-like methyltransferase
MTMPLSNAVVNCSINRGTFEEFYAGPAPWDIDKPQKAFVGVADLVTSPVLDAGCGTGEHALYFAALGHRVTGIDFVPEAIRRARSKAAARGLSVRFQVKDALTLGDWGEQFASVIDAGLFHVFSDDDRRRYVQGLAQIVEPGGRLFLMCFSDEEPGEEGPRRVSRQELFDAFADGWEVESIQRARADLNPDFIEVRFSEGGLMTWFAIIRRT